MRLIDADNLLQQIGERIKESGKHRMAVLADELIDIVNDYAEDYNNVGQRWISCSERMPETLTETLDGRYSDCCLVFAEETEWIGMAYYRTNNSKSWWEFADAQNKPKIDWAEITHWMPLPEPPKVRLNDGGADE